MQAAACEFDDARYHLTLSIGMTKDEKPDAWEDKRDLCRISIH